MITPDQTAGSEITLVPSAGQIDLGKLTPMPTTPQDLVEMPMPGIPDPGKYTANKVKQDLAERLNVDISAVNLLEQEMIEWSDSSLGCPQAGIAYQTVITPGYRFLLEVEGRIYEYHTDLREQVVYCENGQPMP